MPRVIQKSSLVLVWRTSNVLKSSGRPSRLEPMARLMRLLDKCSSVLVRTISNVFETFLSAVAARHHGDTHGGKKYACPGADKYICELFFTQIGSAMSHLRCCHTHKFGCRHRGCPKRFETAQEASEHADMEHRHLLFLCPFKDCQSRVAGVRSLKYEFHTNHRDFHIRQGQLDPHDDFRPLQDVELDRSSKTQLYQLILQ